MSLKAIELQIAIPRTQDLGKIQEQLNQRGMIVQHQTAEEMKNKAEKARRQSPKIMSPQNLNPIMPDEEFSTEFAYRKLQGKNEKDKLLQSQHPYKGRYIDISI